MNAGRGAVVGLVLVFVALWGRVPVVFAQPVAVEPEFFANQSTTGDQRTPGVAATVGGGFVVVWNNSETGDLTDLRLAGAQVSAGLAPSEFPTTADSGRDDRRPTVVGLDTGDFVAVWQADDINPPFDSGVLAQRYDSLGRTVGPEFIVSSYTTEDQTHPSVAALPGGFVVTWESYRRDAPMGNGVFGRRFNSSGVGLGTEFAVNTYTTHEQQRPSVAGTKAGGFVVVWESYGEEGGRDYGVFGRLYDSTGSTVGGEFAVNQYTTDEQRSPTVAALSAGGFVVSWQAYRLGVNDGYGIRARRFAANGTPSGAEIQVNSYAGAEQTHPRVAGLADDGFVVAWRSEARDGSAGYGPYLRRVRGDGTFDGTDFALSVAPLDQMDATAVAAGSGVVTAVSSGLNRDDDLGYEVRGQRFFAPGITCGDANASAVRSASDGLITLQTAVGSKACPLCVCDVDSSGGVTASDALLILRASVGQSVSLVCAGC